MFSSNTFDPKTDIPDLKGKVYVVTGGTAGLGLCFVPVKQAASSDNHHIQVSVSLPIFSSTTLRRSMYCPKKSTMQTKLWKH